MSDLRAAYRGLDPAAPLVESFIQFYAPRRNDRLRSLAVELAVTAAPLHVLLVGQRGTGKTTELLRLSRIAEQSDQPFVRISVRSSIGDPNEDSGLLDFFYENEVACIGSCPPSGLVLIDGCERLPEPHLFFCLAALSRLNTNTVVVAPSWVTLHGHHGSGKIGEWDRVVSVPALPVTRAADGSIEHNHVEEYLSDVIYRRSGLGVFYADALQQIILNSGGIHRDLLALAQQACIRAAVKNQDMVFLEDAQAAIQDRRQELLFSLTPFERRILLKLAEGANPMIEEIEYIPLIERNLLVMYYTDSIWLAVHPLVNPKLASIQIAKV